MEHTVHIDFFERIKALVRLDTAYEVVLKRKSILTFKWVFQSRNIPLTLACFNGSAGKHEI